MEPVDTPGVAFPFVRENSGNVFELIQYKKQLQRLVARSSCYLFAWLLQPGEGMPKSHIQQHNPGVKYI